MEMIFSHDMEAILFLLALIAGALGSFWYAHRGELAGTVAGVMERPFGISVPIRLAVRRLISRRGTRVRLDAGGLWAAAATTLSADEARECALALDEGGARRCGRLEVAPDYDTGDGSRMRILFPPGGIPEVRPTGQGTISLLLNGPFVSPGRRLLLTKAQAKAAAAILRRAAQ